MTGHEPFVPRLGPRLRIDAVDRWDSVIRVAGTAGRPHCRRDQDRRRFVGLVPELPERCGTASHGLMRSENAVRLRVGTGEEVLSPRWGWVSFVGRNPALTRWAIIWRPSGPGASAIRRFAAWGCARNADTLDVSHRLDSCEGWGNRVVS